MPPKRRVEVFNFKIAVALSAIPTAAEKTTVHYLKPSVGSGGLHAIQTCPRDPGCPRGPGGPRDPRCPRDAGCPRDPGYPRTLRIRETRADSSRTGKAGI